ncbi:Unknown protein [Striga hermonthica]|uniref:Uncharacterized protein n=1 Tax=Striga hermonthica TaxID=68872 RepID=A0A9N7MZ08_STRHE|nr:Unknown protein [Striga hermonthica]
MNLYKSRKSTAHAYSFIRGARLEKLGDEFRSYGVGIRDEQPRRQVGFNRKRDREFAPSRDDEFRNPSCNNLDPSFNSVKTDQLFFIFSVFFLPYFTVIVWLIYAEQRMNMVFMVENMGLALPLDDGFMATVEQEKWVMELMDSMAGRGPHRLLPVFLLLH